jgi:hypothetical protein
VLRLATEELGGDSERNWIDDAKEPSDTGGDDDGENERKKSEETLPFERLLGG